MPNAPQRQRRFDNWAVEPANFKRGSLDEQLAQLMPVLEGAWAALIESARPYEPLLQYVVYTTLQPSCFRINRNVLKRVLELGAVIDCDLYWVVETPAVGQTCVACHTPVPATFGDIRRNIRGDSCVAELRFQQTVWGFDLEAALSAFDLDSDDRSRRHDGIDVGFLERENAMLFASDQLPVCGRVDELQGPRLVSDFVSKVSHLTTGFEHLTRRELWIGLTDRSTFQGSSWLHFDGPLLRQLVDLNTDVLVELKFAPQPLFNPIGDCFHCGVNVLSP